jgi:hypothetical protein
MNEKSNDSNLEKKSKDAKKFTRREALKRIALTTGGMGLLTSISFWESTWSWGASNNMDQPPLQQLVTYNSYYRSGYSSYYNPPYSSTRYSSLSYSSRYSSSYSSGYSSSRYSSEYKSTYSSFATKPDSGGGAAPGATCFIDTLGKK